jgi:hypothetical protein
MVTVSFSAGGNKKSLCFKSQNVPTGFSDCHNIISTVIKGEVLHEPKKLRYYRSYKTFDIENFLIHTW